jgi:hypothetical protein
MDRLMTLLLSRLCSIIAHRTTVSYMFLVGPNRPDSFKTPFGKTDFYLSRVVHDLVTYLGTSCLYSIYFSS